MEFLCRVHGIEEDSEFVKYECDNYVNAAKEYAKDLSHYIFTENPQAFLQSVVVETLDEDNIVKLVKIDDLSLRTHGVHQS